MLYRSLHNKIAREWGKPNKCELCNGKNGTRFEWSNKDHKYSSKRKDWWELCSACHRDFDAKKFGRPIPWNKGMMKRADMTCECGKSFRPWKDTSMYCSKSCSLKGNKRGVKKTNLNT